MHQSFRNGFEKSSAPRWYKEYLKDPAKFTKAVTGNSRGFSSTGREFNQMLDAVSEGNPMIVNRNFGFTRGLHNEGGGRSDIERVLGLRERFYPHNDLPMSHPMRRSLYVKDKQGVVRMEPSEDKKDYIEGGPRASGFLQDEIDWGRKSLSEGNPASTPYRYLGSKNKIDLSHATPDAKALVDSPRVFSPAALERKVDPSNLFAVESKHKANIAGSSLGSNVLTAKGIPESLVQYRRSDFAPREVIVPGDLFKNHLENPK